MDLEAQRCLQKQKFEEKLLPLCNNQSGLMTKVARDELIAQIKEAKARKAKKTNKEYRLLHRYDIIQVQGTDRLIQRPKAANATEFKYVVALEEMYDILHEKHEFLKHGGRDRMEPEMCKRYYNFTRPVIKAFIELCETCHLKRKQQKKGLVVKPIVSQEMNSRCQIDLIDMQSNPSRSVEHGEQTFRFIMVYQDHLTKFVILRPLCTKTAREVAFNLKHIFSIFGAPHILQSDNGREFANSVIKELLAQWPGCKMVHGRPRHSQSQGSVERCNQDVENMTYAWMRSTKNANWVDGLHEIADEAEEGYGGRIKCVLCVRALLTRVERRDARQKQLQQADRMVQASAKRFKPASVGDNITIQVPDVDRGRADARNVLGIVLEESEGFYTVGTRAGVLQNKYLRSEIAPCSSQFISPNDVPDMHISLRTAAGKESLSGGQGYTRCACQKSGCKTALCGCVQAGRFCTSHCKCRNCCNKE